MILTRSVIDQAHRRVRESDGLGHDEKKALRADVERTGEFLLGEFSPKGAHGVVVYACSPAGLFEVIRLARPVETRVVIDDSSDCQSRRLVHAAHAASAQIPTRTTATAPAPPIDEVAPAPTRGVP